jgi:hypothetical protein
MRQIIMAVLVLAAGGCVGIPVPVVPAPQGGQEQLCPARYPALTYHNVPVINQSRDGCPVRVDLITTPAAVTFRRAPEQFLSASNMRAERWIRLGKGNQEVALQMCHFENPIFDVEPFGAVPLQVPHPRWGSEDIEINMVCSAIPGTGCEGQDTDRVRLRADRNDSSPFWQDGETEELRCRGIRKIRD